MVERVGGSDDMGVDVKISITMHCNDVAASVILGPSENTGNPEEEKLKRLVWPYNYSKDGALLPGFSSVRDLTLTTI